MCCSFCHGFFILLKRRPTKTPEPAPARATELAAGAVVVLHGLGATRLNGRVGVVQELGSERHAVRLDRPEVAEGTTACKATHLLQNEVKILKRFAQITFEIFEAPEMQYSKALM